MEKMGKNCRVCVEWQEHCYWSHMADDNKHFLKLMSGDFTESMALPGRFANNFNGHISEDVKLKPPSGRTWSIGVANSDTGEVVLQSGWKEFVSAHSIEEGDQLLFRYSGASSFDVLIFDPTGCEKASPHFAEDHGISGRPPVNSAAIEPDECGVKEGDEVEEDEGGGYYYCKNGPVLEYHLSEEDKEEINGVRVPVEPGNPVFVQVMHQSHVRTTHASLVGVASGFAAKYLGAAVREVVLERASRRGAWHVRFARRGNSRGLTGRGWCDFARDTGLVAHDVCLFELMTDGGGGGQQRRRRQPTITVHVLRKVRGRFTLLR